MIIKYEYFSHKRTQIKFVVNLDQMDLVLEMLQLNEEEEDITVLQELKLTMLIKFLK